MSDPRQPTSQECEDRRALQRGEGKRAERNQAERASLGSRQVAGPWAPRPSSSRRHAALLLSAQQILGNRVVQRLLQSVARQQEAVPERKPPPRQTGDEEEFSQQSQGRAETTGTPQSPGFMMAREPATGPGARSWQGLAAEWQARREAETQGQHGSENYNPMAGNLIQLSMGDPFLRVMDGPAIQADKKKGTKKAGKKAAKKAGKKAGGAVASLPVPAEHRYPIKGQKTLYGVSTKFLYDEDTGKQEAGRVNWGLTRASETMVSEKRVKNIVWKLDPFTVVLPDWQNYSEASEAAKSEWDRFMGRLRVHEDGHVKICQDGLKKIPPKWKQAKGADIYDLQEKVDQLQIKIHNGIDKRHKDYDSKTDHGATQGATLDIKIR